MPELKKLMTLDKVKYFETHLSLVNCLLPIREDKPNKGKLTPMEISVLAAFMSLEGDVAQYRFGPTGKKLVMIQLGIKAAGLSNYFDSLLKKGFLIKQGDMYSIWPILIPDFKEQTYIFRLVNNSFIEAKAVTS